LIEAYLALLAQREPLELQVRQGLLDQLERQVQQEPTLPFPAQQDHKAFKAILDQRVHKAFKVFKAFKEFKALLDQLAHRVFKAFKVTLALQGQQAQLVQLDCKARQVLQGHKEYKV
jgi:hypothetical protein